LAEGLRHPPRVPLAESSVIALEMLEGVADMHRAGVIQRDLKPSNVFLAEQEEGGYVVKLVDFGIAKIHEDEPAVDITHVDETLGTFSYMPPEQIHRHRPIGPASDLWAVDVVLPW